MDFDGLNANILSPSSVSQSPGWLTWFLRFHKAKIYVQMAGILPDALGRTSSKYMVAESSSSLL